MSMEMLSRLEERAGQVNRVIERYLPQESGFQRTILEAMNYSVRAGGKRLRPILMSETYRMFGGEGAVIEPFMAAIELIHTYSLVHDDLPAMDNDEYRRNQKTTHALYGEAMGILAGDALLNYAYETAMEAFEYCRDDTVIRALRVLAQKAGIYGMVGGQVVDVESEKKGSQLAADAMDYILENKTGALFEASMMIGAILAGCSDEVAATVERIASLVGTAFQIQDDILDITGSQEELGKPIGSDERNEKTTYVTLSGIERAKEEVQRRSDRAVELLQSLGRDDEFLRELFMFLIHRRT